MKPYTRFTLRKHLNELKEIHYGTKQVKLIPKHKDISEWLQISMPTVTRLMNEDRESISFDYITNLIAKMRELGFDTKVTDLIEYIGPPVAPIGECEERSEHLKSDNQ